MDSATLINNKAETFKAQLSLAEKELERAIGTEVANLHNFGVVIGWFFVAGLTGCLLKNLTPSTCQFHRRGRDSVKITISKA